MRAEWISRQGARELVLFFSGWGTNQSLARAVEAASGVHTGFDVLAFWGYDDPQVSAEVMESLKGYASRSVIAWSFGVWAAAQARWIGRPERAVAFNGTLHPVSDEYGIPPHIFSATLARYDERVREKFLRRMCGGSAEREMCRMADAFRTSESQRAELAALERQLAASPPVGVETWEWTVAVIGEADRIFPPASQYRAWMQEPEVAIRRVRGMAHYPFLHFSTWQEMLACLDQ